MMFAQIWDSTQNPINITLDAVLAQIRNDDLQSGLIYEPLAMNDVMDGNTMLDAIVVKNVQLNAKMLAMKRVMNNAMNDPKLKVKEGSPQISEPFTKFGTANIAALFELEGGQTITVFFHNPDTTPKQITGEDMLISYKFLLNKKDVTIVVAPERGQDIDVRQVAVRILKLAEKNQSTFERRNANRTAQIQRVTELKAQVESKTKMLNEKLAEIRHLEERLASTQLRAEIEQEESENALQAVNSSYQFANATDEFKIKLADSLELDDYSPFLSAKNIETYAKQQGAELAWSVSEDDWLRGEIKAHGELIGLIDMASDGKAHIMHADKSDVKGITKLGNEFTYFASEDLDTQQDALARLFELVTEKNKPASSLSFEPDGNEYLLYGKDKNGHEQLLFQVENRAHFEALKKLHAEKIREDGFTDLREKVYQKGVFEEPDFVRAVGNETEQKNELVVEDKTEDDVDKKFKEIQTTLLSKYGFEQIGGKVSKVLQNGAFTSIELISKKLPSGGVHYTLSQVYQPTSSYQSQRRATYGLNYSVDEIIRRILGAIGIVTLSGNELGEFDTTTEEGKKALREAAFNRLVQLAENGDSVFCPALNADVGFSKSGAKKFKSLGANPIKNQIAAMIKDVIRNATLVKANVESYDENEKARGITYSILKTAVTVKGEEYGVRTVLKKLEDGQYQYDVQIKESADLIVDSINENGLRATRLTKSVVPQSAPNQGLTLDETNNTPKLDSVQVENLNSAMLYAQSLDSTVIVDNVSPSRPILGNALSVLQNNLPINVIEGNIEQAKLESEHIQSIKEALITLDSVDENGYVLNLFVYDKDGNLLDDEKEEPEINEKDLNKYAYTFELGGVLRNDENRHFIVIGRDKQLFTDNTIGEHYVMIDRYGNPNFTLNINEGDSDNKGYQKGTWSDLLNENPEAKPLLLLLSSETVRRMYQEKAKYHSEHKLEFLGLDELISLLQSKNDKVFISQEQEGASIQFLKDVISGEINVLADDFYPKFEEINHRLFGGNPELVEKAVNAYISQVDAYAVATE